MDSETFGVNTGEHPTGEVVHRYLCAYAERFGIYSNIRFNSKVETVEKVNDRGWLITYAKSGEQSDAAEASRCQIHAQKLIIATGTYSEPSMPKLEGSESFGRPLLHSKALGERQDEIRSAKRVVILAGSKSGYDAAYMAASSGVEVDWIIRESGRGAIWIGPPYVTGLKKQLEKMVNMRLLTWFSPCTWGTADGFGWIRRLLHGTAVGRFFVNCFWKLLASDVLTANAYDKHPGTQKLKPWTDAFWVASSFSILNYPEDFFNLVRAGRIRVHVSDISHLSSGAVHLTTGESITTDALVCCTGWKNFPGIKFLPWGIETMLGMPYSSPETDLYAAKADEEIFRRFPRLRDRPVVKNPYTGAVTHPQESSDKDPKVICHPFRLYRLMVPPALIQEHNIGFAGMISNFSSLLCAQTQALWLTAYLDGQLQFNKTYSPSVREDLTRDTFLHTQSRQWRYPFGNRDTGDFVFDAVPYIDWLLGDLGLRVHRKNGRLAEWLSPYGPADYRGLVDEWKVGSGSDV